MQDAILIAKIFDESNKIKLLIDDISTIEITRVYIINNILPKINCHLNSKNNTATMGLRVQNIKKYERYAA